MQYFDSLPKVVYRDKNGNLSLRTNLLARASFIPETLKNPMLYYQYDIQEGDTPEIVAHKYYNDMYRYWIVLFANQMLDPQWSWPLSSNQFEAHLKNKYGYDSTTGDWVTNPYSTVHHYTKTITQYDSTTFNTTTHEIDIDADTYDSLTTGTTNYNLPTGQVSVTVEKSAVSCYEYETNLNESKRTINLLNVRYVDEMETEFLKLMS